MSLTDVFKNLALDSWYKALVYIGGLVLVASLFVDVKSVTNGQAQLLALGVFLVGLGEWKNHKDKSWIKPPNVYTGPAALMSMTVREPDAFGMTCDILGALCVLAGAVSIVVKLIRG